MTSRAKYRYVKDTVKVRFDIALGKINDRYSRSLDKLIKWLEKEREKCPHKTKREIDYGIEKGMECEDCGQIFL